MRHTTQFHWWLLGHLENYDLEWRWWLHSMWYAVHLSLPWVSLGDMYVISVRYYYLITHPIIYFFQYPGQYTLQLRYVQMRTVHTQGRVCHFRKRNSGRPYYTRLIMVPFQFGQCTSIVKVCRDIFLLEPSSHIHFSMQNKLPSQLLRAEWYPKLLQQHPGYTPGCWTPICWEKIG